MNGGIGSNGGIGGIGSNGNNSVNSSSNLISFLFRLQVSTKMFHWQTRSYAVHVATDKLFDDVIRLTDDIIEQYMGLYGRPRMSANVTVPVTNMTKGSMTRLLRDGIAYLSTRLPKDQHIQSLRDDLTGAMAKVLYLLTMN